jgi:hypothetical protein
MALFVDYKNGITQESNKAIVRQNIQMITTMLLFCVSFEFSGDSVALLLQ